VKIVNLKISDIIPYGKNPRINDKAVDKTAMSLKEYGWQRPLVIDKNNVVIDRGGVEYLSKKCRDGKHYYKKVGCNHKFSIATCQQCGILYMASINNFKKYGKLFCSLSCSTTFKNKTVRHRKKVSEGLKKLVVKGGYLSSDRITKMRNGSNKYYLENENKVKETLIRASKIAMKTVRKGVNRKSRYYCKGWVGISKKIRKKIPYCQFCGGRKLLQVHHIIPFKHTKNNSLNNLIVLCARCHKKTENEAIKLLDGVKDFDYHKILLDCLYDDRKSIVRGTILNSLDKDI